MILLVAPEEAWEDPDARDGECQSSCDSVHSSTIGIQAFRLEGWPGRIQRRRSTWAQNIGIHPLMDRGTGRRIADRAGIGDELCGVYVRIGRGGGN
jgi:hypothetical protein